MDKPALFYNELYIYWHGIFMALAIVVAACTALAVSALFQRKKALMLFDTMLLAFPFGFLFSRALYCASNYEEFRSITEVLRFSDGGYGLYGAIFGAFMAAVTLKRLRENYSLGAVCDSMAAGGALGIAVGRLAGYVSFDNVGNEITSEKYQFFPIAVYNEQKDLWALATFNIEALTELVIFVVLCVIFARNHNEKKRPRAKRGDIALLFLMMHGASEVVFDSMQTDALKFPGNSFVRIQQIVGALSLVAVMIIFVIRSIRRDRLKMYHLLSLAVFSGMIAVAAYMELGDRISDTNYYRNHFMMLTAMICASVICIAMYSTTTLRRRAVSR